MYTKFIDTVSIIVKTYGIGILSDNKFWNIMTDSYNFSSGYSLRDEFKKCIANGNFSAIDSLQSDRKNALKFIKDVVQNNTNYCNTKELTLCLFSVAIAIGTCSKTDYCNFTGSYCQNPSPTPKNKPKTAPKPQNKPLPNNKSLNQFSIWTIIIWGIISLIGSTSLYAWFLLGNAGMFWILCLIGIIQLGT